MTGIRIVREACLPIGRDSRTSGVSLDYLVSDSDQEEALDAEAVKRIKEIQNLPEAEKDKVFSVVDALIRDFKTKQAYL